MKKLLMIAALTLVGCGAPPKAGYVKHLNDVGVIVFYGHQPKAPAVTKTVVEPMLQDNYNSFLADSTINNGSLATNLQDVQWAPALSNTGDTSGTYTIGLCTKIQFGDGSQVGHVQILQYPYGDNVTPWDPIDLKTVVYHELGHCLLGLAHTANDSNQIMEPVADMTDDYQTSNWTSLVQYEFAFEAK